MCYNVVGGTMRKKVIFFIFLFLIIILFCLNYLGILPRKVYSASDFGIEVITSDIDYNQNGIDDYTDILIGARKDATNHPTYRSAYYSGGYPPDNEGVCADVIWRSLKEAGYLLKDLMDEDIRNDLFEYEIEKPDSNIDFRRVKNMNVYLKRNTLVLSNDPYKIEEWQPGDIVVFESHVAIISDKRNKDGIPYIIHNAGQFNREEDTLVRWYRSKGIIGHYRFKLK